MPAPAQTSTEAIVAAARRLLEERGADALTMRDVADAVGVRAPSLYKRVRDRSDLVRLILDDVADELTAVLDAAATSGDPTADLRAMFSVYRRFARANPVAYALMYGPQTVPGNTERSVRSAATLMRTVEQVAGPQRALPAARMLVAWANGFIMMELAGAFRLGGDLEEAWAFGQDRVLAAIRPAAAPPPAARIGELGQSAEPSAEQPVTRTIVSDVRLPAVKATDRVQVREIRILPSQPAGLHVHNGPVFGSIVTGSVVYQIDGQPASVLRPGDVFYEPEGARIARFDAQEDGVTFLAYFLLSPGQEPELTMLA